MKDNEKFLGFGSILDTSCHDRSSLMAETSAVKEVTLVKEVLINVRHARSRNRTGDLQIFSLALSRLSYDGDC